MVKIHITPRKINSDRVLNPEFEAWKYISWLVFCREFISSLRRSASADKHVFHRKGGESQSLHIDLSDTQ